MYRWKSSILLGLLLAVVAVGGSAKPQPAHAATTRVWTGAVNLTWSTAGNWAPAGPPVDGDSVVIGAPAFGKTLNNNRPADLVLASLTINTGGLGQSVTIVGNRLGISSAIQVTGSGATLDLPIVLRGDVQLSTTTDTLVVMRAVSAPAGTVAVDMAGRTLTKTGGGEVYFFGDVLGVGTLAATGGGVGLTKPVTFGGRVSAGVNAVIALGLTGGSAESCGIAPNAMVALSGGKLIVGCPASIRAVSGTGEIEMAGADSRLFLAGSGDGAVFDGKITGAAPSAILCCSNGGQTFRGVSTFSGQVVVSAGSLTLEGATFPATSGFTVQGGGGYRASLGGYGTFGQTIFTGSDLHLVDVNGKYGLARFPVLQFAPDVVVDMEIAGSTPGTGFTQIVMSGEIYLDSALLRLTFRGYTPAAGQAITLVKGATDLQDTFKNFADGKNLPEGGTFTVKGQLTDSGSDDLKFKITYTGGAGHDVVITRQAGAATPTPTPTPTATPTPTPGPVKFKRFVPMVARENYN